MPIPGFHECTDATAPELRARVADRIRSERRNLGLTQIEFATRCGISARTFKRLENGTCDSLEAFLRVIIAFERTIAIELLFPPKTTKSTTASAMTEALERIRNRI